MGTTTATTTISYDDTATSTREQVQTNLYYGFILFFITAALVVAYFTNKFKET